jgi:hypothetical protein
MPIKLPATIAPLLAWSRNEVTDALLRRECPFASNIETAVFVACYGFHKSNGILPPAPNAYLAKEPIAATTYQTEELFPQIMMMAVAASQDAAVVNDEDRLCRIFEAFVDHGAKQIVATQPAPYDQEVLLALMRELPTR